MAAGLVPVYRNPADFRRKRYAEIQQHTICGYLQNLRENKKSGFRGGLNLDL